ncbi:asparagine synthase (glutamine-hydrolyzing) [Capillimicrobium parvum]|nr:asparagine synthase (glutamine-hydrolyzing) [Capillimicrobium parvum]
MCGIGGIVGSPAPEPGVLERMAEAMARRGPDGQGTWAAGGCGLAFRRLAIIDLADRAMQPMSLGPLRLVFNGEVYDYRERRAELEALGHAFVTESDTEVLLHAWMEWGEGALDRINAMFAFGVYDERDRSLTLAADPFGEKPLLYVHDDDRLVFASDVQALQEAVPGCGAPDRAAMAAFVSHGTMPPVDRTFFARIRRLPGGHVLRWRDGDLSIRRYWAPQPVPVPDAYPDAVAELRELLLDSIRLRLRSDVPVGTSLSGGVDSSAIVTLSAFLAGDHRRHAFTARFPGYERDEWRYAEAVARAAGVVEHHAAEPTLETLAGDLRAFVGAQQEPVLKLNQYAQWAVFAAAREAGVTVLLDGQGADELLAGYILTRGFALRSLGPRAMARAYARDPATRLPLRLALARDLMPQAVATRMRARHASPYATAAAAARGAAAAPEEPDWPRTRDPLRDQLLREAFFISLPHLLRYGDRNSMAHSREVRLPFLDRRVAELALSLPPGFLLDDGVTKRVLRDAVRDLVPAEVLARRDKVGFEPPQAQWLGSETGLAWAAEVLLDPAARESGIVDAGAVEADLRAGAWRDPDALWRAMNVELWRDAFDPARRNSAVGAAS